MGSDAKTDPYFWGAEAPVHRVTLDAFWIYQTEVTNAMYRRCVADKLCPKPGAALRQIKDYSSSPAYDQYPVVYVTWAGAISYCQWAGGRLPSEAEWEKAARGDQDGRLFPWGSQLAANDQANFCDRDCPSSSGSSQSDGYKFTAPVGSYPAGVSPYGTLDMAGNVWEWVNDWFQPGYYESSPLDNPIGPASSRYRSIRGGSWLNPVAGIRIVQREGVKPDLSLETLGFRCAADEGQQ